MQMGKYVEYEYKWLLAFDGRVERFEWIQMKLETCVDFRTSR